MYKPGWWCKIIKSTSPTIGLLMSKREKSSNKHAPYARSGTLLATAMPFSVPAGFAAIILAVFIAYFPSINGGFVLDDEVLTENELIKAPDGLFGFWCSTEAQDFWPMTNSTFWIEWRLWGTHPGGYHVSNMILHITESLLIWMILRKLSIPGAFLAAMIFAVHPVNVESIAWIAQRKNAMAMLFLLLSILWYLKADSSAVKQKPSDSRFPKSYVSSFILPPSSFGAWYCLSLAAFILAMLSKGSVAILPVLLLGIVWWLRPLTIYDLVRTGLFLVIGALLIVVNLWFQTHGAESVVRTAGFIERLLGACAAVWFYLYKAILPIDLVFVYPRWHIEAGNLLWWLPLLATAAVTTLLWLYRKSWSRPFLFAWGFFCTALVPVMGFTNVGFMKYSLVADHYQHIAIIGIIALTSTGISLWRGRTRHGSLWVATAVAFAAVCTLVFLTRGQSGLYHGPVTLYKATLEKNPQCSMAHYNLGHELAQRGQMQEALEQFRQTLKLDPDNADAENNLGFALDQMGRTAEAIEHYQKSLQINPNYAEAHNNLGIAMFMTGRPREAIEHHKKALLLKPNYAEAYNNMGNALKSLGRYQEAIDQYRKALLANPYYADAYNNLGNAYQSLGQCQQAIDQYQKALSLNPNLPETHNNLGVVLVQIGRPEEAIQHYRLFLRIKPEFATVHFNLALAYANMHQSNAAMAAARKALDLARSQGLADQAKQIEDWMKTYQRTAGE